MARTVEDELEVDLLAPVERALDKLTAETERMDPTAPGGEDRERFSLIALPERLALFQTRDLVVSRPSKVPSQYLRALRDEVRLERQGPAGARGVRVELDPCEGVKRGKAYRPYGRVGGNGGEWRGMERKGEEGKKGKKGKKGKEGV